MPMLYVLAYDYVPDVAEKRTPFRAGHLSLLQELHGAGKLAMAGAYDPPADGALIVFKTEAAAQEFVSRDPYVKNGIVTRHRIRPWNVVVG